MTIFSVDLSNIDHFFSFCDPLGHDAVSAAHITLQTCIWEVPRSNLAGMSRILTHIFHSFPQSLPFPAGTVPRVDHERILPNPAQFGINELPHSQCYTL
jgi:hypothetical protein